MRTRTLILGLAALLAGCSVLAGDETSPVQQPAPTPTEAAPTLEAPTTPSPLADSPDMTGEGPSEIVLTVWTSEGLSPSSEAPGGQVLVEQLAAFDETHPDIRVEIYVKRSQGPGSTLAYLRTAPPVAPDVLPDVALLDQKALAQATAEELIVPIGSLLDPAIANELYPAARELGTIGEQMVGLPYALEVQHLAYRVTFFQEPPNSFEAILESPVPYVFPAAPEDSVNHTLLLQYMAAVDGNLTDEEGRPVLDADALREVLGFYADARAAEVVDPALFQITDPAETWALYRDRQANLAATTSTLYLAERDQVRNTAVTWTPTPTGDPYALVGGWSWAIVTQDPERQAAAMLLLNFLMNPVNQGTYTQASYWLPTQPAALAVWGDGDPYTGFGDLLLRNARPLPDPSLQSVIGGALQEALEAVLLNDVPPVQAATEAAQSVNPPQEEAP